MTNRMLFRSVAAAAVLAACAPALAQYDDPADDMRYYGDRNGWQTIGRKSVNGQVDYDRIRVQGAERFRKLRVCSVDHPFELREMSAEFANGRRQQFMAGMIVRDGHCTHAFDLAGKRRNIDNIYLTYSRVGWGARRPQLIVQAR